MSFNWKAAKQVKEEAPAFNWGSATLEGGDEVKEPTTYHGEDAIQKVAEREGELNAKQRRIVELEGFVDGEYEDHKGIKTFGVGQTGEFMNMSFKESFDFMENQTRRLLSGYDAYPDYLQAELVQAAYRGDLQQSRKFRSLLNAGDYTGAAAEFLDHNEYLDNKTPMSIKRRLESVADAVARYAKENDSLIADDQMMAQVESNPDSKV